MDTYFVSASGTYSCPKFTACLANSGSYIVKATDCCVVALPVPPMAHPLPPLNPVVRHLIYDLLLSNKITLYTTYDSASDPNRFPDTTSICNLLLVCHTVKSEVDHHYAVVARQHYVALARALGIHPAMVGPVASSFLSAHTMTLSIALDKLQGLPERYRYPALERVWQFLPPFATEFVICVCPLNAKHPLRQGGYDPQWVFVMRLYEALSIDLRSYRGHVAFNRLPNVKVF